MELESKIVTIFNKITYRQVIPAVVVGVVVMFATMLGIMKYSTSKPSFCLSCHSWQAYSNWTSKSEVHPYIDCAQCHADHGEFVPKDYKAEAERVEPNCLRCHKNVLDQEMTQFKKNVMNITIPHLMHIEDIEAKCTDCHRNIAHDRHASPTNRPRMEFCYDCHDPVETPCTQCHPKGSVDLPKMDVVSRSTCRPCHPDFARKELEWEGHKLTHSGFVKAGADCNHCHSNKEKHGQIKLDPVTGCKECHD